MKRVYIVTTFIQPSLLWVWSIQSNDVTKFTGVLPPTTPPTTVHRFGWGCISHVCNSKFPRYAPHTQPISSIVLFFEIFPDLSTSYVSIPWECFGTEFVSKVQSNVLTKSTGILPLTTPPTIQVWLGLHYPCV